MRGNIYMGGAEGRGNSTDQPTNQRTVGVEGTKKANVVRQSASITHPSSGINNTKREKAINGPLITMHAATLAHIREEEAHFIRTLPHRRDDGMRYRLIHVEVAGVFAP